MICWFHSDSVLLKESSQCESVHYSRLCNSTKMAKFNSEYDCEPYLRALEEQADGIRGVISGILQAMET